MRNIKSTKNIHVEKKSHYRSFSVFCIILLVGIFLPEYLGIHYLTYSFVYMIVLPLCILSCAYFKLIKKANGARLYVSCWASFCMIFTSYTGFNTLYTTWQTKKFFLSKIENVIPDGYRSPPSILFPFEDNHVALVVKNEYPIKDMLDTGHEVKISGYYKKGLLSSIMIIDYTIY